MVGDVWVSSQDQDFEPEETFEFILIQFSELLTRSTFLNYNLQRSTQIV